MSTTLNTTIEVPQDVVQALDEISESMSMTREATLRVAVMRYLEAERALVELRSSLQAAAKAKGIETEEDLYAILESEED